MQSKPTMNRRHVLAATAAGLAGAAVGASTAPAADDQDRAEWLALWQRWLAQSERHEAAIRAVDNAKALATPHYPAEPKAPMTVGRWEIRDDLPRFIEDRAANETARKAHGKASDAWSLECDRIDEAFGIPALMETAEAEEEASLALDDEITERPANSWVGVAVKLALARYAGLLAGDHDDDDAAVSAWRNATRLAGLPENMGEEWKRERRAAS